MKMPPTPELKKQSEVINSGKAELIQDFIDWLAQEKGLVLARYVRVEERYYGDGIYGEQPVQVSIPPEQLMAEFFDIDLKKIDLERQAVLNAVREAQGI